MSIRSTFPAGRGIWSSWTPWCRRMEHCGWLGMLLLLTGCAHSPIVESWRQAAADQPSFEEISADPEAFTGQKVILGGEVARAKFQPEVAEIEIWQKRLDSGDRPEESFGPSQGRFLVRCSGALDPADYFRGSPLPGGRLRPNPRVAHALEDPRRLRRAVRSGCSRVASVRLRLSLSPSALLALCATSVIDSGLGPERRSAESVSDRRSRSDRVPGATRRPTIPAGNAVRSVGNSGRQRLSRPPGPIELLGIGRG